MSARDLPPSCKMNRMLLDPSTQKLVYDNLVPRLREQFPDRPIDAISAAIKAYLPEATESIVSETVLWEPHRTNYAEAVKMLAKKCAQMCEKQLHHVEPDREYLVPERALRGREDSVW